MSRRFGLALTVAAVLTAACSGPHRDFAVGSKEVPIDLVVGARQAVARAPVPPAGLDTTASPTGLPTFERMVVRETDPAPPSRRDDVRAGPCPEADPLAVPALVAPNGIAAPPKPATYVYRTKGVFAVGGSAADRVVLPASSTVTVFDPAVDPATGDATWRVAVKVGETTTTTSYRVTRAAIDVPPLPEGAARTAYAQVGTALEGVFRPALVVPAGLFITRVETTGGLPFQPPPPGMMLAKVPLTVGDTFDVAASDGTTTMQYRSVVDAKQTVDACGTPLDAHAVTLKDGKTSDAAAGQTLTFTAQHLVGTQYGGLLLASRTTVFGTELPATPVVRSIEMTIDTEPKAAP